MKKIFVTTLTTLATFGSLGLAQTQTFKTGLEVMQAIDARPRPKSSTGTIALEISKNGQTLSRQMRSWSSGDNSLIKFLAPADVKGSGILTTKQNNVTETRLWLPALNRVRRLATGGSDRSDCDSAFFGSDFSYCDLGSFEIEDYSYNLLSSANGKYMIEAKPVKRGSYDKLVLEIDATTLNTLKTDYYRGETVFKTLKALEFGTIKGYNVIRSLVMETPSQGSKSTFKQTGLELDVAVADSVFTERFLRQP